MVFRTVLLFLLAWLVAVPANAETVEFTAASTPLSKFKIRKMKAAGIESPQPEPGTSLSGELFVPEGDGPFPAIVLNHDCRGLQDYQRAFAETLADWGYVTLLVDSYGPRGVEDVCPNIANWDTKEFVGGRALDVYGALGYLTEHQQVDRARLGVIGWDRDTTLSSVAAQGMHKTFPSLKPKAAIAITPDCRRLSSGDFASPILIIAAERDDWWPAENCTKLLEASKQTDGAAVDLIMLEADHGFDDPTVRKGTIIDAFNPNAEAPKATLAFDERAAKAANERMKEFLKSALD